MWRTGVRSYGRGVITWVLERAVFSDDDEGLARAVREDRGGVVAWSEDWWVNGRWLKAAGEAVLFHGSLANADRIARELPWSPGAFCSTAKFACTAWWPDVAHHLVSDSYLATTVGSLVADGPPSEFGDRVFVRPDSALKPFSGRVLGRDAVTLASLDHGFYYDDLDLPVMVSPAVRVGAEWRFVINAQGVVVGSSYEADGRTAGQAITSTHEAWAYADEVAADLTSPDPLFVMDICQTDLGYRLLELNPFSGADLYGCERPAVVQAVRTLVK